MKNYILEELNRIKYLFDYQKGVIISEQQTQDTKNEKTMGKYQVKGKVTPTTTSETIKVIFTKKADFEVGESDPSGFILSFVTEILNKLKEQNPDNKPLKLDSIKITAGASNVWGKKTYYDVENDYVTPNPNPKPKTDTGYDSNVTLSTTRAQNFWVSLKSAISGRTEPPMISISETIAPTFKTLVVNTNGVKDKINMKNNPKANPGQFVSLDMNFSYTKETTTYKYDNSLGYGPVTTSTYWCDGSDGAGNYSPFVKACYDSSGNPQTPSEKPADAGANTVQLSKQALDKGVKPGDVKHDFITKYILKFKGGEGTWTFGWKNQKIVSIYKTSTDIGKDPKTGLSQVKPGSQVEILSHTKKDDLLKELETAMNFPKFSGGEITKDTWRKSYDWYVKPYL